jgi:sugar/nucleoside kinase (ribokinase family)
MNNQTPQYDFFAIGEALVDFISENMVDTLAEARQFDIFVGGQTTNLAIAISLLGKRSAIAACVGEDGLGRLIRERLDSAGVATDYLQQTTSAPTTLSIIARHTGTPDFIIHRGADTYLGDIPEEDVLGKSRIVHTSAFALARQPARSTILRTLSAAHNNGSLVTLDPNYHPDTWPDSPDFIVELKSAFQYVNVTKPSLDDCIRLFGAGHSPQEYANCFMEWGPSVVIITMGAEGVLLCCAEGTQYHIQPNKVLVADVTGAGDAFWAGYLFSWLEGAEPLESACFGQVVAEAKIGVVGPISQMPPLEELRERALTIKYRAI